MAKIKYGKFVNFDDLLPSFIAPSSNDDYSIQISELGRGTSLSLVPRAQASKVKVVNFHSWLEAWCIFARIYSFYFPHRVSEILFYQNIMTQYAK